MDGWSDVAVQILVVAIPAVFAVAGVLATNWTTHRTSRGPEWDSYADGLREDMEGYRKELVDVKSRLTELEAETEELRERHRKSELRAETLEADLFKSAQKYDGALSHIRAWRDVAPEGEPVPPMIIAADI